MERQVWGEGEVGEWKGRCGERGEGRGEWKGRCGEGGGER